MSVAEPRTGQVALLPVSAADEASILALNNAHAVELSLLTPERLSHLLRHAFYARRVGDGGAFLTAFDQGADYDSPNYLWFRERYPRFVYVDRIVVDPAMRKRRLAHRLYEDLFIRATEAGHTLVVCEVNSDPPNPASDAFHKAPDSLPWATPPFPVAPRPSATWPRSATV